ncbi:cytochrome c biogenesis CcdA family protein [Viridibacillus arvi]|uniref:cytochrome c biogenesis CcdA family protein n=1 Tax=Viridibacillus arvi TaxID=263475 RepID=UPI003D050DC7
MSTDLNLWFSFGAGLLSFISPCVFPLYPAFLSYITGMSVSELKNGIGFQQKKAILHTAFFIIGFSVIYLVLGFSASAFKAWFLQFEDLIQQVGSILIVIFGFVVLGVLKPSFLMKDHRVQLKNRPSGYFGSMLIGLAFAAGWTPCTGPILGSILTLVGKNPEQGIWYMVAYILGFSIPFFTLAFFVSRLNWIRKFSPIIMKIGGVVMIVVGVVLFFDQMNIFNRILAPIFGDFIGF